MHQEELDILGVVDKESLVAGGHHVAGLLVGAVTDLRYPSMLVVLSSEYMGLYRGVRTEGMAIWPLKRRRTALSIPLGLRHEGATHLNRSDW